MFERRSNNPLLQKAGVGRARQTTAKLPPEDFVYGKIFNEDPEKIKKSPRVNWPKNAG